MPNEQKPGLGRRIINFSKVNAASLVATAAVAGGVAALGYFGGKAALVTAGVVGGGMFAVVVTHEVVKLAVELGTTKIKESFAEEPKPDVRRVHVPGGQQPGAAQAS